MGTFGERPTSNDEMKMRKRERHTWQDNTIKEHGSIEKAMECRKIGWIKTGCVPFKIENFVSHFANVCEFSWNFRVELIWFTSKTIRGNWTCIQMTSFRASIHRNLVPTNMTLELCCSVFIDDYEICIFWGKFVEMEFAAVIRIVFLLFGAAFPCTQQVI